VLKSLNNINSCVFSSSEGGALLCPLLPETRYSFPKILVSDPEILCPAKQGKASQRDPLDPVFSTLAPRRRKFRMELPLFPIEVGKEVGTFGGHSLF
jgi:hypothetical protein